MSGASRPVDQLDLEVAEREYRGLLRRWYPQAWLDRNGEAVIGTLLDLAEQRGSASLSLIARMNFAGQGLLARLSDVLVTEVQDHVASIGVGTVAGFSLFAVLTSVSPTVWPREQQSAHFVALLPFLIVWLLVALTAFVPNRRVRLAGFLLATVTTVATSGAWWSDGPFVARDTGSWWFGVTYYGPACVAPAVLLLTAGVSTMIGRARAKGGAAATIAIAATLTGLLLILNQGLVVYEPDWVWARDFTHLNLPTPFLGVLSVDVLIVIAMIMRRRRRVAFALLIATTPWLLAWLAEIVINPTIGIAT